MKWNVRFVGFIGIVYFKGYLFRGVVNDSLFEFFVFFSFWFFLLYYNIFLDILEFFSI